MKLVGYVRVSSKDQESNTSLEDQEAKIKAYCVTHGHDLVKIYREVASGKDAHHRPEFQEALEAVRKADGIIAIKLDRIARNTLDVLQLVKNVLDPQNKALVLIDMQVDTSTPTGRMILTVMASVAQLERETIYDRCKQGRKAKRDKGGYIGGRPDRIRYGYDLVGDNLIPNPDEQAVLETIRKRKRRGQSLYAIAQYLNKQGVPTKTGAQWSHVLVGKLVQRP